MEQFQQIKIAFYLSQLVKGFRSANFPAIRFNFVFSSSESGERRLLLQNGDALLSVWSSLRSKVAARFVYQRYVIEAQREKEWVRECSNKM